MIINKYYGGTPSNVRGTNHTLLQQEIFPAQFSHCGKHGLDNLIEDAAAGACCCCSGINVSRLQTVRKKCSQYSRRAPRIDTVATTGANGTTKRLTNATITMTLPSNERTDSHGSALDVCCEEISLLFHQAQ